MHSFIIYNQFKSIVFLILFFISILIILSIKRRSELIKYRLKKIIIFEVIYILSFLYFQFTYKNNPNFNQYLILYFFGVIVFLFIFSKLYPKQKRNRYIPENIKKRLIKEFESRTGKKYNSRQYEIHHIIPYSRGGNSTIDNLKIIPRHKNRKIKDKSPWWDMLKHLK